MSRVSNLNEKKEQAFSMYCLGIQVKDITKELGIRSRTTIWRWSQKYNWGKKKQQLLQIAKEKGTNGAQGLHRKVAEGVIKMWMESTEDDSSYRKMQLKRTTHRDAMEAVKLSRLLEGESTENYEVTKTDITIEKIEEVRERARKRIKADTGRKRDSANS